MSHQGKGRVRRVVGALAFALAWPACSLGNIAADDCDSDAQCAQAFGLGSVCSDGFCTESGSCTTGHDCRAQYGGGACLAGACTLRIPPAPDGSCALFEPSDLPGRDLAGHLAPVVVGGMFSLGDSADPQLAKAAQLALREINESGLGDGRPIGMVVCDVGGPDNSFEGETRKARIRSVVDYLAGTLGVPFVVGPVTSADSLTAITHLVANRYPTVLISPAATSPALTTEPDRLDPADPYGLFWRTAPSDVVQGEVMATDVIGLFPVAEPTLDQVAVIYVDDSYGAGLANVFQSAWGVERTDLFPFDPGVDWDQLAAQVAAQQPDALVMVAVEASQTVGFITAMAAVPSLATKYLYLTDGSKDEARLLAPGLDAEVKDVIFNQVVGTAPAAPTGADFNLFRAAYEKAFDVDPTGFAFVANAYDAAYVGAAGVVYAASVAPGYDGRTVAEGLSRLIVGPSVSVGPGGWGAIKSGLTTDPRAVDVVGLSGDLAFDPVLGEAPAPIEVWQPTTDPSQCNAAPPCFARIAVLE